MTVYGVDVVARAMLAAGLPYRLGAEVDATSPEPGAEYDCSELTQWAHVSLGVYLSDGTWAQEAEVRRVSVETAIATPGALLHTFEHVAISRGDGTTIEARGARWGVGSWSVYGRSWSFGGFVDGVNYSTPPSYPLPPLVAPIEEAEDMAWLVQADDGDIAVFTTDGVLKSWVRDGNAAADLTNAGISKRGASGQPIRMNRAAIDSLVLVGPAPIYAGDYTGPRTGFATPDAGSTRA